MSVATQKTIHNTLPFNIFNTCNPITNDMPYTEANIINI